MLIPYMITPRLKVELQIIFSLKIKHSILMAPRALTSGNLKREML